MSKKVYSLDSNHAGIQMVNRMRSAGQYDDDIKVEISKHEASLQQRVNGQIFGKTVAHVPTEDEITKLRTLEVAQAYLNAEDMSKRDSLEKVAKAQHGISPSHGGKSMSGTWQQMRDDHLAAKAPSAAKPGEFKVGIGRLSP
jgi:hypothetical protein